MEWIDWLVLLSILGFIVVYGTIKTRTSDTLDEYFLTKKDTNWLTIGFSVMVTQASAITFLSIPGQAYDDGMGFLQFYFGLPLAMIFVSMFFLPVYYRLRVYTAYEFIGRRLGAKTRSLTAFIFLLQRGLLTGVSIYAPAIILSTIFEYNSTIILLGIGLVTTLYTYYGGSRALNITQKQQAIVMFFGMIVCFLFILFKLPEELTFGNSLKIAASNEKLNMLNFSTDLSERYTIWNGITGGFFLMLAYFGTDHSQVSRYITGKSIREARIGLIMNGILKIPMQFFILLVGVMMFVFYQINKAPLHFNVYNTEAVKKTSYKTAYEELERQYDVIFEEKKEISMLYAGQMYQNFDNQSLEDKLITLNNNEKDLRKKADALILKANPKAEVNDQDYVFIHFIVNNLPKGVVGLLLAVVICALMSSVSSGIYSLASSTSIDLYRPYQQGKSESHYLKVTRLSVLLWGGISILSAFSIKFFENLIQQINIIGSMFYGTILGVFFVALFVKYSKGIATFWAAVITQLLVIWIFYLDIIGYLWFNLICGVSVVMFSLFIQFCLNLFIGKK